MGKKHRRHRDNRKDRYADYHLRKRIYKRDHGQCQYCGAEVSLEDCNIDHVIPRSQKGSTERRNLVVACRSCNARKRSQFIPIPFRPIGGAKIRPRPEERERNLRKALRIPKDEIVPHVVGRGRWRGMRDYAPEENGPVRVRKPAVRA